MKLKTVFHTVTIIGSSRLVLLFNAAPILSREINVLDPTSGFCFDSLLAWGSLSLSFPSEVVSYFIKSFKFQQIYIYPVEDQRVGNCPVASGEGGVFGYMGLSKILKTDEKITEELIVRSFDSIKSFDNEWKAFNHWDQFYKHRKFADPQLVAAIESLILIDFAKETIHRSLETQLAP